MTDITQELLVPRSDKSDANDFRRNTVGECNAGTMAKDRLAAWERLMAMFDANPIVGDGRRFNREELHDRD